MPRGSKVNEVYQALLKKGYDKGKAARIAQAETGQALATGRPPKHAVKAANTAEAPPPGPQRPRAVKGPQYALAATNQPPEDLTTPSSARVTPSAGNQVLKELRQDKVRRQAAARPIHPLPDFPPGPSHRRGQRQAQSAAGRQAGGRSGDASGRGPAGLRFARGRRPEWDLYVVYEGANPDTGQPIIKAFLNPLVGWIWIGLVVMVFGSIIALIPSLVPARPLYASGGPGGVRCARIEGRRLMRSRAFTFWTRAVEVSVLAVACRSIFRAPSFRRFLAKGWETVKALRPSVVVSHPFRKEREKDGARGLLRVAGSKSFRRRFLRWPSVFRWAPRMRARASITWATG